MSAKELEIKLQFLEEAQEYLDNIEMGLLEISKKNVTPQELDSILRSAHSIKGGAGMMGFSIMADLAHKLEDFFKILKAGKHPPVTSEIESLFLSTVDNLKIVSLKYRQGEEIENQWLETEVIPIFNLLHDYFGDPTLEDEVAILTEGSGEDLTIFLFETEVENCLQRLENLLNTPDAPCVKEEFQLVAEELSGLGEMLELSNFSEFCAEINQTFRNSELDLPSLAQQTLKELRRCQALILTNQKELLPHKFEFDSLEIKEDYNLDSFEFLPDNPSLNLENEEINLHNNGDLLEEETFNFAGINQAIDDFNDLNLSINDLEFLPEENLDFLPTVELTESLPENEILSPNLDINQLVETENLEEKITEKETLQKKEATLRVPLKNLEALTDLFGELTIERNGLDLNLKSLGNLLQLLQTRVKFLEKYNFNLQNTYDQISTPLVSISHNKNGVNLVSNNVTNSYNSHFDILEMDRYNDLHLLSGEVMETIVKIQEITSDLEIHLDDAQKTTRHLTRTSKLMQNHLTQVRMRPLSDLVGRFPRTLREMSLEYGKKVQLKVRNAGTLIDRLILESLGDPLLHLFRNAFDHGIEDPNTRKILGKNPTGTIEIIGSYRGNQTIITIKDDGAGINIDKIKEKAVKMGLNQEELNQTTEAELLDLIFEPGFSTAEKVTDLSGRGVGMDIVRTNLRQVRGEIQVNTEQGKGTTFIISVPFTLSVVRVLLVEIKGMLLAFPSNSVEELLLLYPERIQETAGQKIINLDGYLIPLIELNQWLNFNRSPQGFQSESLPKINQPTVLIIAYNNNLVGLKVDKYWNEQEVTIRPVEGNLKMPSGFTGCTILGDGTVVPLIDAIALINWINEQQYSPSNKARSSSFVTFNQRENNNENIDQIEGEYLNNNFEYYVQKTIMIIDDSINVRRFLALTLEKAGYLVEQAKDGQDALEKLQSGIKIQGIICDVEMPRLDGYGFLAHVKSNPNYQNIPIFMLTSRSGQKHRQIAINLGANGYFSKPFKEQELLQTLAQFMN